MKAWQWLALVAVAWWFFRPSAPSPSLPVTGPSGRHAAT